MNINVDLPEDRKAVLEAFMASNTPDAKRSNLWDYFDEIDALLNNKYSLKKISEFLKDRGVTKGVTPGNIFKFFTRAALERRLDLRALDDPEESDTEINTLKKAMVEIRKYRARTMNGLATEKSAQPGRQENDQPRVPVKPGPSFGSPQATRPEKKTGGFRPGPAGSNPETLELIKPAAKTADHE